MTNDSPRPRCFIAMPITVHEDEAKLYRDPEHWKHVIDHLFKPAIEKAGYQPIEPTAVGTSMIHARIVEQLIEADLVLVDLSQHNPNVFFELGVRTSLNRPVVLVKDEHLGMPFDIGGLNTLEYDSSISTWTMAHQVEKLANHIKETVARNSSDNPLWRHFGMSMTAETPAADGSPVEAKLDVILDRLQVIERVQRQIMADEDTWIGGSATSVDLKPAMASSSHELRQHGIWLYSGVDNGNGTVTLTYKQDNDVAESSVLDSEGIARLLTRHGIMFESMKVVGDEIDVLVRGVTI